MPPRRRNVLRVEVLESRHLMAVNVLDFPIPTPSSQPFGITAGPDGNVWFTETGANQIGMINPTSHAIVEFPIPTPNAGLGHITSARDGDLWFTETKVGKLGSIDPTTHVVTEYSVPDVYSAIASTPDGKIWFGVNTANRGGAFLGEMDLITHEIIRYPGPPVRGQLAPYFVGNITADSLGNIWLVNQNTARGIGLQAVDNAIFSFDATTKIFTQVATFGGQSGLGQDTSVSVENSTLGPDGRVWYPYTDTFADHINGTFIQSSGFNAYDVTTFTGTNSTGRMTNAAAPGSDGNLWFLDQENHEIARLVPATGAITDFPTPSTLLSAVAMTAGPDGNVWLVDGTGNSVGQVQIGGTSTRLTSSLSPDGQSVLLTATVDTAGVGTPNGIVTFLTDGVPQASIPVVPGDTSSEATFTVHALSPGPHTVSATYNGDENFNPSRSNTLRLFDHPKIVNFLRTGVHLQPTRLILSFERPMDAGTAQNVRNYFLVRVGPHGFSPRHPRRLPITSARYDPVAHSVTLTPRHRLPLQHRYQLTVNGIPPGGLTDLQGSPLLVSNAGSMPSNYTVTFRGARSTIK